jgi:hypothetical protein
VPAKALHVPISQQLFAPQHSVPPGQQPLRGSSQQFSPSAQAPLHTGLSKGPLGALRQRLGVSEGIQVSPQQSWSALHSELPQQTLSPGMHRTLTSQAASGLGLTQLTQQFSSCVADNVAYVSSSGAAFLIGSGTSVSTTALVRGATGDEYFVARGRISFRATVSAALDALPGAANLSI